MRRSILAVMLLSILSFTEGAQTVNVTSLSCGLEYDLEELGTIDLVYFGADLGQESVCKLMFYSNDRHNDLCIAVTEFANECQITVEYHAGYYQAYDPDKTFCHTAPPQEWCSGLTALYIAFEKRKSSSIEGNVSIQLQISTKSTRSPDHNPAVLSLSVLIGVIVVAVVVLIALVAVMIVLYLRRRQAKRQQAYQRPRSAVSRPGTGRTSARVTGSQAPSMAADADARNWLEMGTTGIVNTGIENPAFDGNLQTHEEKRSDIPQPPM